MKGKTCVRISSRGGTKTVAHSSNERNVPSKYALQSSANSALSWSSCQYMTYMMNPPGRTDRSDRTPNMGLFVMIPTRTQSPTNNPMNRKVHMTGSGVCESSLEPLPMAAEDGRAQVLGVSK